MGGQKHRKQRVPGLPGIMKVWVVIAAPVAIVLLLYAAFHAARPGDSVPNQPVLP